MFLRKELVLILIMSIIIGKIKTATGRFHEGSHKGQRELNKLNLHGFQTRHYNHYLHKKHKCNLERSYFRETHVKKSSRYPTLDKIVHRLDNQIDHLDKSKMTTTNPFDEWNMTGPPMTTTPDKAEIYAYVTVGLKGKPVKVLGKDAKFKEDFTIKLTEWDIRTENVVFNKGFMQDRTTSSPWLDHWVYRKLEQAFPIVLSGCTTKISRRTRRRSKTDKIVNVIVNVTTTGTEVMGYCNGDMGTHVTKENEQHDINAPVGGNPKNSSEALSNILTLEEPATSTPKEENKKQSKEEKIPSWSIDQLGPRLFDNDERKKKTTPMPYVAAHAHYDQVLRMGDCHIPKEKVIKVHEVHPNPSKSYSPSCTILHQCGDDTGCCRDLKQVCKPKNTTKVELYFFTTTVGKPQTVEKLHFVNHTECECQKRTEEPLPRDSEFRRSHQKKHVQGKFSDAKKRNHCTCPARYSVRLLPNDSCVCDCFDKQDDCLVLKKGKAHFSHNDKLCIQSGICLVPLCEFGSYIRQFGRCPNKSEKYHYSWSRILSYRDLIT